MKTKWFQVALLQLSTNLILKMNSCLPSNPTQTWVLDLPLYLSPNEGRIQNSVV
jgi:hypothetical protein